MIPFNFFVFLAFLFLMTFLIGREIERFRIPWIFSSLILGAALSFSDYFQNVAQTSEFRIFAELGMFFLLFMIGFEIDLKEFKRQERVMLKSTLIIILSEALFSSLFAHYLLHLPWSVSIIVALSFATVGEAVLIPILDEFRLIKRRIGQSILGIGILDDIVEVIVLTIAIILMGDNLKDELIRVIPALILIFLMTTTFRKLKKEGKRFVQYDIETLFLFSLFILFLFIGIGSLAEAAALSSLLAGISLKTFLPSERERKIENEIRTISYGFFAPIFFFWVGVSIDFKPSNILLVLLLVIITSLSKIFASILSEYRELGLRGSIILGVGLSVRFSTGLIIIKMFLDKGLINQEVYTILVSSSALFVLLVPPIFLKLLKNWNKNII